MSLDLSKEAIQREIEAKKKKLEELKARRAQRIQAEQKAAVPTSPSAPPKAKTVEASVVESVDQILRSVPNALEPPESSPTAEAFSALDAKDKAKVWAKQMQTLARSGTSVLDILPVERTLYHKEVQVDSGIVVDETSDDGLKDERDRLIQKEKELEHMMQRIRYEEEKKKEAMEDMLAQKMKKLSASEKSKIVESDDFRDFFDRATRTVERALNSTSAYDIMIDYSQDDNAEEGDGKLADLVVRKFQFQDQRTENRPVTSLHWSPKYEELILAAYGDREDITQEYPEGTVLVWSTQRPQCPEYVFTCQSSVMTAVFHPANPKLIVGGTRSGMVVLWDTREKSTPVDRTSLSKGHTHPVFAAAMVPLVNRVHNIVSISTDAQVCVWSDNNLHEPALERNLCYNPSRSDEEIVDSKKKTEFDAITAVCFDYAGRDTSTLYIGSDEGMIYKANIYDTKQSKEDTKQCHVEGIQAHDAPITALRFHPGDKRGTGDLTDLFLTCSFDWTIKLWTRKRLERPIYTFDYYKDYIYDVKWSPSNPALFVSADGTGNVEFWDLNKTTEKPVHTVANEGKSPSGDADLAAVSQLCWNDHGKLLAVGNSIGNVAIYEVSDDLGQSDKDASAAFYDRVLKRASQSSSQ